MTLAESSEPRWSYIWELLLGETLLTKPDLQKEDVAEAKRHLDA